MSPIDQYLLLRLDHEAREVISDLCMEQGWAYVSWSVDINIVSYSRVDKSWSSCSSGGRANSNSSTQSSGHMTGNCLSITLYNSNYYTGGFGSISGATQSLSLSRTMSRFSVEARYSF